MRRRLRGFTLAELAVVVTIIGLLLATTMFTFSAQVEQRNRSETQRRIEEAKELLLSFALVYGRLPCPGFASGGESGGGAAACTNSYNGFLPARAIGFQPVDAAGFGLDAWGNRIRYAVSGTTWSAGAGRFTTAHATTAWSLSQTPADLVICSQSPGVVTATTCDANTSVTNQNVVVAIVFSSGKNGATGGTGVNEARNLDNNQLFVSRPPDPADAPGGEFDDMMAWIPVGLLYGRMIAGGVLP